MVGIPFEVRPTGVEELAAGDPRHVAAENARRKALAEPGPLVLGADTDVELDGDILGKPADDERARAFLQRLSGRTHQVVGGIALAADGELIAEAVEVTTVRFRSLDEQTVDWYVGTGEWRDRAGGYAIQGRGGVLVARIEGDYLNVVGLPVGRLAQLCGGFAAFLANGT
jgi:septum formation protein